MLYGTVVAVLKARELTQVFGDDYNGSKEKAQTIDFQQSLDGNFDDNLPFKYVTIKVEYCSTDFVGGLNIKAPQAQGPPHARLG